MRQLNLIIACCCLITSICYAQPAEQRIKIVITPEHADWNYKAGEQANFNVTVFKYGVACKNITINYEIGAERMMPTLKGSLLLKDGHTILNGGTLNQPGFLRCIVKTEVDGSKYRNLATVGFDVFDIKPTVNMPVDFSDFWKIARDTLARIPLDSKMILLPERCTEKVNVYEVNIQNYGRTRLYGIVCIPKATGKYPALLNVPGAGVRSYYGSVATAERGFITLDIGIHGIPVTMDEKLYAALQIGILKDYYNYNLDNKDRYYYKRVYLGCLRANDFLCSLPQFDGHNLGVAGGSQGGALALVTAALDNRVIAVTSMFPAMSDITGYLYGRAGGWPHLLDPTNFPYNNTKEKLNTIGYYDAVNFAKLVKIPIKMSWGYNDEICPPTTSYAVYNSLSSKKYLEIYQDTGHWTYPEESAGILNWMLQQLKQ